MIKFDRTHTKAQATADTADNDTLFFTTDGAVCTGRKVIAEKNNADYNPGIGKLAQVLGFVYLDSLKCTSTCNGPVGSIPIDPVTIKYNNSIVIADVTIEANTFNSALQSLRLQRGGNLHIDTSITHTPTKTDTWRIVFLRRSTAQVDIVLSCKKITVGNYNSQAFSNP